MAIRHRADHLAQLDIGVEPRFVSESACAHAGDRQRPALTQFLADQMAHSSRRSNALTIYFAGLLVGD